MLIDFSLNPLIALYFAVREINDDGRVFVLSVNKSHINYEDSAKMKAIACLSHFHKNDVKIIKQFFLANEIKNNYIRDVKKVLDSKIDLSDSEKIISRYIETLIKENIILDFKPKNLFKMYMLFSQKDFERIKSQEGVFLVNGNPENFEKMRYISNDEKIYIEKFVFEIKNDYKEQILKELRVLGIRDSVIFPELENFCFELKRNIGK